MSEDGPFKWLGSRAAIAVLETAGSRAEAEDAVRARGREGKIVTDDDVVLAIETDGKLVLWITRNEYLERSQRAWKFVRVMDEVRTTSPFSLENDFKRDGDYIFWRSGCFWYPFVNRRLQLATTLLRKLPKNEAQLVVRMLMG